MIGVLCIHGFTGSPKEVDPLVRFFKEHTDWLVKSPTLPGHGEMLSLKGVRFEDWIQHAENELHDLLETCETVYICGFSMGGLIGSWLAAKYKVDKLVLLSAAAYYTNPKKFCKELFTMIKDSCKNHFQKNHAFQKYIRKFRATPVSAYIQFCKLVQSIRPQLPNVDVPTFIVQGKKDPIVPEKSAHYIYKNICATEKKLLFIEEANHLICYGEFQEMLFSEILQFLNTSVPCEKIAINNI
ncbi:alpha/beta fold hydrolase [Caldibacillus lycopersici]|uniref:Alpha/beta fold hydrolase n=1 Tax=Perspicuibacillus lycopersici TaxID=1325689 RepID=A0AAE3IX15_9BACI|nr:alpha/beta fold hydrolase [Perspicuibacillus lycopersici]MCU9615153.1 alpha/beta fold hydrolase [Perspicuibacillus lycopersici]